MSSSENQLVVKTSTIPGSGNGLFTKKEIAKGARIVEYTGEIITWKQANKERSFSPYIFYVNRNHVIDAVNTPESLGRYANDARGMGKVKGLSNNAQFEKDGLQVYLVATKKIPAGGEIFVGYGKDYWDVIRKNAKIDADAAKKKAAEQQKKTSK